MDRIEDYQIRVSDEGVVIAYPLTSSMSSVSQAFVLAKKREEGFYDLIVSNEDGDDVAFFAGLEKKYMLQIRQKKIYLVGIKDGDFEKKRVCAVLNLGVE